MSEAFQLPLRYYFDGTREAPNIKLIARLYQHVHVALLVKLLAVLACGLVGKLEDKGKTLRQTFFLSAFAEL